MFQVLKGLNKDGKDNVKTGWVLNMNDENTLRNFVNINRKDEIITHTLSDNFDLSNTNKQEQEMILVFNEPEDEIELAPNEKALIKYSVRKIKYESTLNLKQKITGTIRSLVIDYKYLYYESIFSIKEAMQILQKYSLLPDEITLNEDNSITFNGKAKISLTQEAEPKLIINTSIV